MDSVAAVVIGSGAFGASTAYHLARRGAQVTLVDQHALGSQTSPRAAGLTSKADATPVMARLRHEACDAFEQFEARWAERRLPSLGQPQGCLHGVRRGAPLQRARERPRARHRGPLDLRAGGPSTRAALRARRRASDRPRAERRLARARESRGRLCARAASLGARMQPFTLVERLLHADGKVLGVATKAGEICAPVVVDAAGAWTARVAAAVGITIPLIPVRHQLFITEPIAGVPPLQPIVRLLEASVYVRYAQGGLMFGGYEDRPAGDRCRAVPSGIPDLRPSARPGRSACAGRRGGDHFPVLRGAPVALHRGGAPTMTPDGRPLLGRCRAGRPLRRVGLLRRRAQPLAGGGASAGRPDPRWQERSRPDAVVGRAVRGTSREPASWRRRASASTRGSTHIEFTPTITGEATR